jgi:hypothetical protein
LSALTADNFDTTRGANVLDAEGRVGYDWGADLVVGKIETPGTTGALLCLCSCEQPTTKTTGRRFFWWSYDLPEQGFALRASNDPADA